MRGAPGIATRSQTAPGAPAERSPPFNKKKPLGSGQLPNGQIHSPSTTMEVYTMSITQQIDKPYQIITDRILTLLEQGTVPWHKPWDSATGLPRNLFSQRPYRGINVWVLTAMGYASPFWATFNQVKTAGGSVRKGERGVPVVFWKVYDHEDPDTGDQEKRFVLRQYTV